MAAMAEIAPANSYSIYLRQPEPVGKATELLNPQQQADLHLCTLTGPQVRNLKLPTALWFQLTLPISLRSARPDVVHCPDFLAPFWNFGPKIPTIITVHDLNVLRFRQNFTTRTYWAWRLQVQMSCRRAALILTGSEASRQDIINLLKVEPAKVKVTLYAADPSFKPASQPEIERVKAKFGLDQYIFWVGSLIPQKNLERLLRAFALLRQQSEVPHKLVLGGQSAWGSSRYAALIQELGLAEQVLLPGFIDQADLFPLFSGAALFVFPSVYEGFGLPPLEAMACGCPVAVSNVSSLPEVVGDAAEYFDPLQVTDIAAAMSRVLTNPTRQEQLRQNGIARAATFSWHKTAQQTLSAYQEVLDSNKR
jgi:glycosyltransferase involved in cell wall biosynthesis